MFNQFWLFYLLITAEYYYVCTYVLDLTEIVWKFSDLLIKFLFGSLLIMLILQLDALLLKYLKKWKFEKEIRITLLLLKYKWLIALVLIYNFYPNFADSWRVMFMGYSELSQDIIMFQNSSFQQIDWRINFLLISLNIFTQYFH